MDGVAEAFLRLRVQRRDVGPDGGKWGAFHFVQIALLPRHPRGCIVQQSRIVHLLHLVLGPAPDTGVSVPLVSQVRAILIRIESVAKRIPAAGAFFDVGVVTFQQFV